MQKFFIYKDEKSQKFWNIEQNENCYTVVYGRLGTDGQTQTKEFPDQATCEKEVNKLISQKTKKGYVEADAETVANSKDEAKKYALTYEEAEKGKTSKDLMDKVLKDKKLPDLKHISIGAWEESYECSCQQIINTFIEKRDQFQHIESLFIGDMDFEECEVSWIKQGDYSNLYAALPNLKKLTIKGSQDLELGNVDHANLEHLEIICGGLPLSIIHSIVTAKLPNLKTLTLYIGVDEYGFDGSIENLKPLTSKQLFPNLTRLGLVDSEIQDEITEMILESSILPQLEILDLSYGCITDKGGQLLLDNTDKIGHLSELKIEYHYFSDEMIAQLKKLPIKVDISAQQEQEEYDGEIWTNPMLTE